MAGVKGAPDSGLSQGHADHYVAHRRVVTATGLAGFNDLPGPYWFLRGSRRGEPTPTGGRRGGDRLPLQREACPERSRRGQRVTLTTGCTTTTYVGNYFEWSGSATTSTSYYYAGGTRVAMRTGTPLTGTVNYLLGDHLGSSSVSYRVGDGQTVTQRYYPWGTIRPGPANVLPTDYTFTGQKLDASAGLMYYGGRYYDSYQNGFASSSLLQSPGDLNHAHLA